MTTTVSEPLRIFLAEDDEDDREFFKDALKDLNIQTNLTITTDGLDLMTTLDETVPPPPYAIFLDLNMPRKNGLECLSEIKRTPKLSQIPVIIFSTSDSEKAINSTYSLGANYYICKPRNFKLLKKIIQTVLTIDLSNGGKQTPKEKYFLAIP